MCYIGGKLAAIRLRTGISTRALADLERAEQRRGPSAAVRVSDSAAWLGLVRAELHACQGETAAAARQCAKVLALAGARGIAWWAGLSRAHPWPGWP